MDDNDRDYFFDNIKGILIFFVVFGHFIEQYMEKNTVLELLYATIYVFHMPFFLMISGYFSKGLKKDKILNLLFVYFLWNTIIYPICESILLKNNFIDNIKLFYCQWTYWYLVALIIYRLITPYIINYKYIIPISIVASILIGFIDININILSIDKLIGMYPFFLIGNKFNLQKLKNYSNKTYKSKSIFIIITTMLILWNLFIVINLPKRILFYSYPFSYMGISKTTGIILRLLIYILSIAVILSIIPFISKNKSNISSWGENSIIIYLTHGIVIKGIFEYFDMVIDYNGISLAISGTILATVFTYGYCVLMGNKNIYNYMYILINPYYFFVRSLKKFK